MNIKPIKTRADHRAALKEIETLMMAKRNTPEGERLDVLVTLVEAYERKHYAIDLPTLSKRSNSRWSSVACRSKTWCR